MESTLLEAPQLTEEVIKVLQADFQGALVRPSDANYDEARAIFNGMIDRHPSLIARCANADDVVRAVNFAREYNIPFAVRGGGHNGGGLGTIENGLVIDLGAMRAIKVDADAKTVTVEGGATWAEVDSVTHEYGMATPSGIISSTGVGGLTLGGGMGHLTRKHGLTIDNLLEAEIVLASGERTRASAKENADLFWAIRGGGGNFGVVTSFKFRLHPVNTVTVGITLWDVKDAQKVMQWYREFLPAQPDEINGFFAFLVVPPGPPFPEEIHLKNVCGVVWCVNGSQEQADGLFAQVREVAPLLFEFVAPMPFPMLQGMFDPIYPKGHQWYWKADFIKELPDEAIAKHVEYGSNLPTMQSTMHMYPINGAAGRVGADETAWAYRDANWTMVVVGVDPNPTKKDEITQWARDYWDATHPYAAGGAYSNMMMDDEGQDRVRASYGQNYDRLAQVKRKYDPNNLFRINQNIKPAE